MTIGLEATIPDIASRGSATGADTVADDDFLVEPGELLTIEVGETLLV